MLEKIDRRQVLCGGAGWAVSFGVPIQILSTSSAQANPFRRGPNAFEAIFRNSQGAVAAGFSDFVVQSPEGNTCAARLAYPLVADKKLPILLFCPDDGTNAHHYDQITGPLAAQGYFVMAVDRRQSNNGTARSALTNQQQNEQRLRRFAEARFLLDTIDAAAAVLGVKADLVDTARVGAIGHGDGAWIAAGLGGWDRNGAASTATRDGRIFAVVGLLPSLPTTPSRVAAQRSPDGVSGMFIGDLGSLPTPARGSGLLGLGLEVKSPSFGGLIGSGSTIGSRRLGAPEPQALAAAIAGSVLFFDWTLRGAGDRKKDLMTLDGRRVEGLQTPLQLRKA
jgi:dienelactone hydrolase